jgi:hypothetical protein
MVDNRSKSEPERASAARHSALRLALLLLLLGASVPRSLHPNSLPPQKGSGFGAHLTLEKLLDRRRARELGELLDVGPYLHTRCGIESAPNIREEVHYSPDLNTVFEIRGPGFLPGDPEYYLYDGAYYVYDPRPFSDPSLKIRAIPRESYQQEKLQDARHELLRSARARGLQNSTEGTLGQGFQMTVVNSLPGPLSTVFGRDATTIRVTGRESISFAGESRRVKPFIRNEQGRGQSLFPRLDMEQDLQVKLDGTIGGKVHLAVDHNSSAFGFDANRINIWYEGYEDDIIRRIDLGGTNLNLPGSNLVSFSGGSQGLFGVKTDLRLGGLELTMIASKEETETETRSLTPTGGSSSELPIDEGRYARDRFFFYEIPDTASVALYPFYGISPDRLFEQSGTALFHVFIDDRQPATLSDRPYVGYAIADLPPGLNAGESDLLFAQTNNLARWPQVASDEDPTTARANWRRLDPDEVGYVFLDVGADQLVLGFYLRRGQLGGNDVLAISFTGPNGDVGSIDEDAAPPAVRMRLIRHPDQESDYHSYPTAPLMMRHVYVLGSAGVEELEVRIQSLQSGDTNPDEPDNVPGSTYLHMFGLDDFDQANRANPDALFDINRSNLLDRDNGFLFMPGVRPFSPPPEIVSERLRSAGIDSSQSIERREELFGVAETVQPRLYTLPRNDPNLPRNRYQILVRTSGTETSITLPQDIVEGSEVVRLDGRQLQPGVDYDIEPFAGGKITLKGDVLNDLSPSSRIDVSYEYRPLIGSGQATLLGASGQYKLGDNGRIASVFLFESRRGFAENPRLGEEPSRTLVGDLNAHMRFQPKFVTQLMNILPFTNTNAPSTFNFTAEAAVSVPNPNTKNTAFVDDMESADESDRVTLSRAAWYWASMPDPTTALEDSIYRVPVALYNPFGEVQRGDINPTLPETEATDGITVLELGFDRTTARALAEDPGIDNSRLWSGAMTPFPGNGIDLTQTRTIEFWLNDGIPDPTLRKGRIHIDFGDISEDFVFFENNPSRGAWALESPRFNREANSEIEFQAQFDDLGWNGLEDGCERLQGRTDHPDGLKWPTGDCHAPSIQNLPERQHPWANGTELNNEYDTEDINGDGEFDRISRFFRFSMGLDDPTWLETDIAPEYKDDPNISSVRRDRVKDRGWRRYRIDFDQVRDQLQQVTSTGQAPNLRQIRYMRIWLEDPEAPLDPDAQIWGRDFQIHDFRFTGNQWLQLGTFATDSTRVVPAPGESFAVGTINNKDHPQYTIPPDATDVDGEGVQAREQALRFDFRNLMPGHEMVTQKTNPASRGMDFTLYNRMHFFTHYGTTEPDTVEFFFRMGTDSLNYYEVARVLPARDPWIATTYDLVSLTDLKFPEDIESIVDTLVIGGRTVEQVTRFVPDEIFPDDILKMTRRGNPSLKAVTRMFAGVRHPLTPRTKRGKDHEWTPTPASFRPLSGEIWFNNIRLQDVKRDVGVAQSYSAQGNFAEIFDVTTSLALRDAEFRGLRQRSGSGTQTTNFNARVSTEASRLVPTLGFTVPVSYTTSRNVSRPKFFSSSDTENTPARAHEQRNETRREGYGFSVTKQPSKFPLFKPTLDRISFSYNESRTMRRSFTTRDTSVAWSTNLGYDISPKPRHIPLGFGQKLNILPTNLKFTAQHQQTRVVSYSVPDTRTGELVARPPSGTRTLSWNGSAAARPLPMPSARYNFGDPRNYRQAHPSNEAERLSIFGFDLGLPTGRSEALAIDLTPRIARFSYSASYGDRRITSVDRDGNPQPDTHQLNSNRTRRVSFDFGLHRRLARWKFMQESQPEVPQRGAQQGEAGGTGNPAPGQGEAAADSTEAPPKRNMPNPIKLFFRTLGSIDPIKVEYSDNRTASYVGVPEEAVYAYRFGFSTDTGVLGFETPTPVNKSNNIDISTAVPLRGALRVNLRFTRRASDVETTIGSDTLATTNINSTREYTYPSVDLNINNLQKLGIFGSKLRSSTLSLGLNRTTSERLTRRFDYLGVLEDTSNRRESTNLVINANWTGQWSSGATTTFSANQTTTRDLLPGQRRENTRRNFQGSVRFKIAPKGGLKLPFFPTLKTGMDILLTGGYNTDLSEVFNNPNDPTDSIVDRRTSGLNLSARGNYTLSRNMNGGMEVGFTRSNRNDRVQQTVTTLRLGFNLTFTF